LDAGTIAKETDEALRITRMDFPIRNSPKAFLVSVAMAALGTCWAAAVEYHVSPAGSDARDGLRDSPFRTIGRAAAVARAGDVITVHEGTYRERVDPAHGGSSEENRIVYQAAPGAKVVIKGSEIVYLATAKPATGEGGTVVAPDFNPAVTLTQGPDGEWWLEMRVDPAWLAAQTRPAVTTALLGTAVVPGAAFVQPDKSPYLLDEDYRGAARNTANPAPGPFEFATESTLRVKVW